ncbi:hypothetical protein Dgeo_2079 [Deinococcus geothermalis DSM 11300]|uniref:Uncharacterized protein n=1 Tax=Deinococcus geothermalis (strain DSM 11300 / CIP 105573 / AG-3a) TaxID=319795 RepID=Q1IWL1_DEIGD|nr:hypothetical protein Dgeo_2079 [Deinococcus geothermalis DSM 11300]
MTPILRFCFAFFRGNGEEENLCLLPEEQVPGITLVDIGLPSRQGNASSPERAGAHASTESVPAAATPRMTCVSSRKNPTW